jgi:FixJ family two-component response regulator
MHDDFHLGPLPRHRCVHILDPDPGTCEALSIVLRLEGFRAGFSLGIPAFFAAFEHLRPDVAIVNLRLGGDSGLAVLRRVKAMHPGTAVLMLQDRPQVENAVVAMKWGAADVLTKPIDMDHLVRTMRETLRLDVHHHPAVLRGFPELTPRERDVLRLIIDGQSNKDMGRELGISARTVEVHRGRVMEKLGARSVAELMRIILMG